MRHLFSALFLTSLVAVSAAQSFPSPAKPRIEADRPNVFIIAPKSHVVQSEGRDYYSRDEVMKQYLATVSDADPLEPVIAPVVPEVQEYPSPGLALDPSPFVVLVLGIAALCRRRR